MRRIIYIVLIFLIALGLNGCKNTTKYDIANIESFEYNEIDDIYDLSVYVPRNGETYTMQMSGIYYREYDIHDNSICVNLNEDTRNYIVSLSNCEDE